jgi:CRISPR-associated protein Csb1
MNTTTDPLTPLTLKDIDEALSENAAAFRCVTKLQPMGGPADKLAPPTYAVERQNRGAKYAKERRIVDGDEVETVLLDSVQAQANKMEEALQRAYDEKLLDLPMVQVDFPDDLPDIGRITVLEAPHRIADAILRDSTLDGTAWPKSEPGKRFTTASTKDASALLGLCPTALIFGVWDSTGDAGGAGVKFARALVSEIVGFGAVLGEKTASRIDPLRIEKKGVVIYEHKTDRWTLDPNEAEKDKKGEPVRLKSSDGTGDGSPSAINHGNIAPSIDDTAGGVSVRFAQQTTVLSLSRLRTLRFGPKASSEAQKAARVYLVALGLAAIAFQREQGYWLRSRCELVPISEEIKPLQVVAADGTTKDFKLPSGKEACALVKAAAAEARTHTLLPKEGTVLHLKPSPKLIALVKASRGMNGQVGQ